MNKKVLSGVLTVCLASSCATSVFASRPISVTVGGKALKMDVKPIIEDGRTLLPLRAVFEAIGADAEYVAEEQKVIATKKDTTVEFVIGSNVMTVNGEEKMLDVPAKIVDGRTLVPVRACAESFGLKVEWNDTTKTVKIRKPTSRVSEDSYGTKYTYNENGNLIYEENNAGDWETYWRQYTYDENGNLIYEEYSTGYWKKYEYDENGNIVYTENNVGFWVKLTYDENGNLIYEEYSDGDWMRYTYNENGNLIYKEYSDGELEKYIYDDNGNNIYIESNNGDWYKYTYDEKGNKTYIESNNGFWIKNTYDENSNNTYTEFNSGDWYKSTYNENGNITYFETRGGYWEKYIVMEI